MDGRFSQRTAQIESVLDVWMRRKWIAIVVFGAVLIGAVSLILSLPDLYRATATALVERDQISEAFVRAPVTAELETRIQSIKEEVMSRARLGDLITRLDLYSESRKNAPLDSVVDRMRRDIRLELKGGEQSFGGRSGMIAFAISYTHRNPQTAAAVANALASVYVDENTKSRERQAARTAGFLKAQLTDAKTQLDDQERHASEFKLQHMSELPQQVQANLLSLERLNTKLRINGDQQLRAIERHERLEKQLALVGGSTPAAQPVMGSPQAELLRLNQQLADLRRQFTDEYPDVVRLRGQIAAVERQLPASPSDANAGASPDHSEARIRQDLQDTEAELQALKNEERALHQAIDGYEQRVENAPKREEEYRTLSRDYETTKERYTTLLRRYEEAQLAARLEEGQQVEQLRILDPALPPRMPAVPNRERLLLMGFALAVAMAIGAAMAAEWLDTAFHSVDELRAFVRVPTLVNLPLIVTKGDVRRQRWRMTLATLSVIVAFALVGAASHYVARGNEQIVRMIDRGQA